MSACVRALATSTRTLKYQAPGAGMRYAGRDYFGTFARSLSIYSRELFAFIVKPMADGTIPIPMIPMIKYFFFILVIITYNMRKKRLELFLNRYKSLYKWLLTTRST